MDRTERSLNELKGPRWGPLRPWTLNGWVVDEWSVQEEDHQLAWSLPSRFGWSFVPVVLLRVAHVLGPVA